MGKVIMENITTASMLGILSFSLQIVKTTIKRLEQDDGDQTRPLFWSSLKLQITVFHHLTCAISTAI